MNTLIKAERCAVLADLGDARFENIAQPAEQQQLSTMCHVPLSYRHHLCFLRLIARTHEEIGYLLECRAF